MPIEARFDWPEIRIFYRSEVKVEWEIWRGVGNATFPSGGSEARRQGGLNTAAISSAAKNKKNRKNDAHNFFASSVFLCGHQFNQTCK